MGGGSSKYQDIDENPDTSDKLYAQQYEQTQKRVTYGSAYNKEIKPDLKTNSNQTILNNKTYYKKQSPNSNFSDDRFPPNVDSFFGKLKGNYTDESKERRDENLALIKKYNIDENNIEWKSAKEIWGENYNIFNTEIKQNDVILGNFPDDYLIASLISLSEFPQLILQLFKTNNLPSDNKPIEIGLKIDGEWKIVLLDDKFPVKKGTKEPICSKANNNSLWGVFLEKAWAKINGGYINICNGNPREVFETLTPFATVPIEISKENVNTLWKNIRDSDAFQCIMTCTTINDENIKSKGLVNNHTYNLRKAFEKEYNNNDVKLIKLINPFGKGEWNGDWGDNSSNWNQITINLFEFSQKKDDGEFYITYEDFLNYFKSICICVPIKPFKSSNFKVDKENANNVNVIKIRMEEPGILTINLAAKDYHFHRKIKPNEKVIYNLILVKAEKNFYYIDSTYNEILSTDIQEPGDYILLYHVDYHNAKVEPRKYTLNIGSSSNFLVCLCEPDRDLTLLKTIIATTVPHLEKYKKYMKNSIIMVTGNRFMNSAYSFLYIKNKIRKVAHLKVELTLNNIISLEGEVPPLQLKKNDTYLLVCNRIDDSKEFKSSVKAENKEKEIENEVRPQLNKDILKQYLKENNFVSLGYNYEFDQVEG